MKKLRLKKKDLQRIGFQNDLAIDTAIKTMKRLYSRSPKQEVLDILVDILKEPSKNSKNS